MYLDLQQRLADHLRTLINEKYSLAIESVPVEIPPDLKFGELATPIALQLARTLRKAPKIIAQEIVSALGALPGFAGFEVAGAGYINARIDRAAAVRDIAGEPVQPLAKDMSAGVSERSCACRAHQHQSQQGRAHRPPAQRHPRRHLRPPAPRRRTQSRCAELHRQHRRAGGRRGRRIPSR